MSTNFVAVRLISAVLTVVAVGLLAGIMLGTGMGQFAGRNLPEANWTLEHQTTDALFRKVMPVFFNATAILLIAASALSKSGSRWMFGTAALLIVVSIVITVRVEVPLNRTIASWTPGAAHPTGACCEIDGSGIIGRARQRVSWRSSAPPLDWRRYRAGCLFAAGSEVEQQRLNDSSSPNGKPIQVRA